MAGRILDDQIRCSFCNKTQDQVRKLIAGPNGVYICDECVEICADIIDEEYEEEEPAEETLDINLLKPVQIRKFLDEYVIGQEDAKKVLDDSDGEVKTAIVMLKKNTSKEAARMLLAKNDGIIARALGG